MNEAVHTAHILEALCFANKFFSLTLTSLLCSGSCTQIVSNDTMICSSIQLLHGSNSFWVFGVGLFNIKAYRENTLEPRFLNKISVCLSLSLREWLSVPLPLYYLTYTAPWELHGWARMLCRSNKAWHCPRGRRTNLDLAPGREQSDPEPELPQKQNAAAISLT